jgi:hypothetical protein
MKIKSQKDLWAGVMFIGFGLFFAIWALTHYQMGTAVRMGPAYFPAVLGGLLAFLGALVLIEAFAMGDPSKEKVRVSFGILDMVAFLAIYVVAGFLAKWLKFSSDWAILGATIVIAILTVLKRPAAKPLVLISAACVAYGYLMKPLGLVLSTAAMVFIAAYGGHEFKWKEVAILYVILIVFSVLVFVKGLTLPFPLWPAAMS